MRRWYSERDTDVATRRARQTDRRASGKIEHMVVEYCIRGGSLASVANAKHGVRERGTSAHNAERI